MIPASATRTKGLLPIIAGPSITKTTTTTTTYISQRKRLLMLRRRNKIDKDIQYDRGQPILPSSPSCIPMTEDEAMKSKVKEETVPPVTALEEYACSDEEEASSSSYPSLDEENSGVYWKDNNNDDNEMTSGGIEVQQEGQKIVLDMSLLPPPPLLVFDREFIDDSSSSSSEDLGKYCQLSHDDDDDEMTEVQQAEEGGDGVRDNMENDYNSRLGPVNCDTLPALIGGFPAPIDGFPAPIDGLPIVAHQKDRLFIMSKARSTFLSRTKSKEVEVSTADENKKQNNDDLVQPIMEQHSIKVLEDDSYWKENAYDSIKVLGDEANWKQKAYDNIINEVGGGERGGEAVLMGMSPSQPSTQERTNNRKWTNNITLLKGLTKSSINKNKSPQSLLSSHHAIITTNNNNNSIPSSDYTDAISINIRRDVFDEIKTKFFIAANNEGLVLNHQTETPMKRSNVKSQESPMSVYDMHESLVAEILQDEVYKSNENPDEYYYDDDYGCHHSDSGCGVFDFLNFMDNINDTINGCVDKDDSSLDEDERRRWRLMEEEVVSTKRGRRQKKQHHRRNNSRSMSMIRQPKRGRSRRVRSKSISSPDREYKVRFRSVGIKPSRKTDVIEVDNVLLLPTC